MAEAHAQDGGDVPRAPDNWLRRLCMANYAAALFFSAALVWMMATEAPNREPPPPAQAESSNENRKEPTSQRNAEPADAGVGAGGAVGAGGSKSAAPKPPPRPAKAAAPRPVRDRWQLPLVMVLAGGLGGALCNLRGIFMYSTGESRVRGQPSSQGDPEFPLMLKTPYYVRLAIGPCVGLASLLVASLAFTPFSENSTGVPSWDNLALAYRYMGLAFLAGFSSKEFMQALKNTAEGLFGQKSAVKEDPKPDTGQGGTTGATAEVRSSAAARRD